MKMLLKSINPGELSKYSLVLIYIAVGWEVLEATDVFIDRFQFSETTFIWLSIVLSLGLVFLLGYTFSRKTKKLKILIVDDHTMVRSGLKNLLENNLNYIVADEASNGIEALLSIEHNTYDVIFTDINMPVMNGIHLCENIKKNNSAVKVIAFSMLNDKITVNQMLEAGASAYLLKSCGIQEIQSAIEKIMNGGSYFSPNLDPI